jgi:hypothetical protein
LWTLQIITKAEGFGYNWNKLTLTFELIPRFGAVSTFLPDQNILFLHGGQNFFTGECYADMFKVKLQVFKNESDNKSRV